MHSSNFEKQDKTEIGLQLVARVLFPFWKIGVTLPELFLLYLGRLPVLKRH